MKATLENIKERLNTKTERSDEPKNYLLERDRQMSNWDDDPNLKSKKR